MDRMIEKLLMEDRLDGVFAYTELHGFPFPKLFTRENLAELEPWQSNPARYPVLKLLLARARQNPEKSYGIVLRGCEERALAELFKWGQLEKERIKVIGQACSQDLANHCECWKPYPDRLHFGTPAEPVAKSKKVAELEGMERAARLNWWLTHLNRCIKCYGCRDVCPVCFCTECSLEHEVLVEAAKLPPDSAFHLIRAVHMGGRCIDCGLCEEVCPARIPLRSLYKEVNRLVEEIFDYRPGSSEDKSPFTFSGEEPMLPEGPR